jgi:hypothetical protein
MDPMAAQHLHLSRVGYAQTFRVVRDDAHLIGVLKLLLVWPGDDCER